MTRTLGMLVYYQADLPVCLAACGLAVVVYIQEGRYLYNDFALAQHSTAQHSRISRWGR